MAVTLKGNNGTYEGTSEDSKPLDVPVNTEFNELDTGKTYYFDGETWNEEPPCEGSGFTPTAEQLAAMNSGIDSTKVAQISTNENNILLNTAEITGQQNATTDTVAGRGYAIINGQRLYMGAAQMPERTGDIWLDGAAVRESNYLLSANPLCGIEDYKDTLNLSTGACSRYVIKLVIDGTEAWQTYTLVPNTYRLSISNAQSFGNLAICSHFVNSPISEITSGAFTVGLMWIYIRYADVADLADFKSYLAQQYTNGTPVTVWYNLSTPTTETITVPSGNVGTVEGYLTQSGTPTPTNPIYPTANEVLVWG